MESVLKLISGNLNTASESANFLEVSNSLNLVELLDLASSSVVGLEVDEIDLRFVEIVYSLSCLVNKEVVESGPSPLDTVLNLVGEVS